MLANKSAWLVLQQSPALFHHFIYSYSYCSHVRYTKLCLNAQVNMTAGVAYAIVVDGYGGNFGQYQIDMVAEQVSCDTLWFTLASSAFQKIL